VYIMFMRNVSIGEGCNVCYSL